MENRVTGVMIYYYFVCKRKLWYFINEINMESDNENVMLGKLLDENSYRRDDKHINIDNVINIDFIKEHQELHEIQRTVGGVNVLIDTWWTVNNKDDAYIYSIDRVLIDTWWNVNEEFTNYLREAGFVLIDTWWNVNVDLLL